MAVAKTEVKEFYIVPGRSGLLPPRWTTLVNQLTQDWAENSSERGPKITFCPPGFLFP